MVAVLCEFVLLHGPAIAFLVASGELAIGLALTLGVSVRGGSASGLVYTLVLLFLSNYPGPDAVFWQYWAQGVQHARREAALDHELPNFVRALN